MRRSYRISLAEVSGSLSGWRETNSLVTAPAGSVHVLRDMIALLKFVGEHKVIGTSSTGNMPLKDIRQFAPLLSKPPVLEGEIEGVIFRFRSEFDVWPIYFLHILADVGGLTTTGPSRRWNLTKQGKEFLVAEPAIQLAFMLCVWWHRVNWLVAYPFTGMGEQLPWGFSDAALHHLADLPPGTDVPFIEFADLLIAETGLRWGAPESSIAHDMLRGSIERMSIRILEKFGGLECGYRDKPSGTATVKVLVTIRLTPLGRALLEAVALIR